LAASFGSSEAFDAAYWYEAGWAASSREAANGRKPDSALRLFRAQRRRVHRISRPPSVAIIEPAVWMFDRDAIA
jgi:hypothetical protein